MRRVVAPLVLALTILVPASAGASPATTSTTATTYRVVRDDVTWTDTTRATNADSGGHLPAKPTRTIGVMVLRPDTTGRHPLIVFVHGVTASGPAYEAVLRPWAEAGYVIAAPTEPLTSGPQGWSNLGDYANQPGDVRFVIDKMQSVYRSAVDGDHVAVAGHSLGAITTIGSVYNTCCIDPRVDAAVEISGVRLPFPKGTFDHPPAVPLLAIHGARDTTVPVSGSDTLYADASLPAHYLRFKNAGHVDLLADPLLARTVIAFFDRYLKGGAHAMDGVAGAVATAGNAVYKKKVATTKSSPAECAACDAAVKFAAGLI